MTALQMIQTILSCMSGVLALGGLIIIFVRWFRNGNAKKILALVAVVPELVKKAEQMFGSGHGVDKFNWVMTMLKIQALATHTNVKDEVLEATINDIVDTTNNVNVDKFPFSNATANTTEENQCITENFENSSDDSETV